MKRALAIAVLAACGPSVAVDGDDDTTTDATTMSSETTAATLTTSTSATTASTTVSTAASTTSPSDATSDHATSSGDEGAEEATLDDTWTYIEDPDGGGSVECDVWAQDCQRGEKCLPWSNVGGEEWNAVICSPVHPAPALVGEPCHVEGTPYSGIDDCEIGAMCWGVDPETLTGECVPICGGSEANPMCADGTACFIAFYGVINLCLPSCDPFAPECDAGTACIGDASHYYDESTATVCLPVPPFQPQPYGEPCTGVFELCDAGLICVYPEDVPGCDGEYCCTVLGEWADPPPCPDPAQTCLPLDEEMPPDGLCYCGVEP